ncbi:MAG: hypothetical protein E2591_16815 [Achromobacter sp.]|uniref:hypothetical protein n=1 Tax=Achromobacter sp. TaxID=134375 RepID=UPI0012CFA55B|nr:hypothetical protein [Achromobacter sp.]MPS79728.1 hypothetical protein [Achromobacter sp.]
MNMDVLVGKLAMDRSSKFLQISGRHLINIQEFLCVDGSFREEEAIQRSWHVLCIDDKSIFGEDAARLAAAFRSQGAESFCVRRAVDIRSAKDSVAVHVFDATLEGVEKFQGAAYWQLNLDDCFLFNVPVTCAVFRPGNVGVTIFAGEAEFVNQMKARS